MRPHNFRLVGAWGSKLTTMAGYRCDRCNLLYIRMNLTADQTGAITAIGPDGEPVAIDKIEGAACDA